MTRQLTKRSGTHVRRRAYPRLMIRLKRAYEAAEGSDGVRVLVDGLWPRGVTKQAAAIEWWARELAPSPDLRRWFGHLPDRFPEFKDRYLAELQRSAASAALDRLRNLVADGDVTLVYAAKDTKHNQAVVLADVLSAEGVPS